MFSRTLAYSADDSRRRVWPFFVISLLGHLLLFGIVLFHPLRGRQSAFIPSVIDVRMVDMPAAASAGAQAVRTEKAAPAEKPPEVKAAEPETPKETSQPEVSVAPKPKTSLKYKTFKSQEVLKQALQDLEQKVESSPPKPLEDTLKRLKEQVAKEEKSAAGARVGEGAAGGKNVGYGSAGNQEGDLLTLYMSEVAYTINKNWAFSEQLAGGRNLVTEVTLKVLPDGKITDIHLDSRSGNAYLDDSALRAIEKSSPVRPHPPGINQPYVLIGLRFTPQGMK